MRAKCLAKEHNTMSPIRARTRTACSRVERTNHEGTVPPHDISTVISPVDYIQGMPYPDGIAVVMK